MLDIVRVSCKIEKKGKSSFFLFHLNFTKSVKIELNCFDNKPIRIPNKYSFKERKESFPLDYIIPFFILSLFIFSLSFLFKSDSISKKLFLLFILFFSYNSLFHFNLTIQMGPHNNITILFPRSVFSFTNEKNDR